MAQDDSLNRPAYSLMEKGGSLFLQGNRQGMRRYNE